MTREELGSLLRLLVDTGRITAADAATMVVRFDLGELAVGELPVPLREMPGRLTPVELAIAMQNVAVRLTPKQAAPFLAAATKPVQTSTPPEVKRFLRERLRNHFRQNYDNTIAGYTHALAQGGDVSFWQKKMSLEQRAYIARMTTAGLGRPLAAAEIDRISQTAIVQQGYLYKFAGEISARRSIGRPHSEAYLQARARQYGGEGWAAWFAGNETVENRGDGYVARYTAHDDERTCGPCLDAMNGSPYLPSQGPLPGQVCRGHGLCRCRREVYFDMETWQRLSGVTPSPTVAPTEPPIVPEPVAPPYPGPTAVEAREQLTEIHQRNQPQITEAIRQERKLTQDMTFFNNMIDPLVEQAKTLEIDSPEWAALRGEIKGLQAQRNPLYDEIGQQRVKRSTLETEMSAEAERLLRVAEPAEMTYAWPTSALPRSVEQWQKAAERLNQLVDKRVILKNSINVEVQDAEKRSFCSGDTPQMYTYARGATFVHEMGHSLEKTNPTIAAKAQAFLDRRTEGEALEWMGGTYAQSEKTRKDKFLDEYMGKEYKDRDGQYYATEITSMGLQYLYDSPYHLAVNDPDYFDFIFNLVRGID